MCRRPWPACSSRSRAPPISRTTPPCTAARTVRSRCCRCGCPRTRWAPPPATPWPRSERTSPGVSDGRARDIRHGQRRHQQRLPCLGHRWHRPNHPGHGHPGGRHPAAHLPRAGRGDGAAADHRRGIRGGTRRARPAGDGGLADPVAARFVHRGAGLRGRYRLRRSSCSRDTGRSWAGGPQEEAATTTVGRIGAVITASAATVIVGLSSMAAASFGMIQTIGPALAIAVAITLLAGLTLTPALALLAGRWLYWPRHDMVADGRSHAPGGWDRLAAFITRRPWPVAVTVLVALAHPARGAARPAAGVRHAQGAADHDRVPARLRPGGRPLRSGPAAAHQRGARGAAGGRHGVTGRARRAGPPQWRAAGCGGGPGGPLAGDAGG